MTWGYEVADAKWTCELFLIKKVVGQINLPFVLLFKLVFYTSPRESVRLTELQPFNDMEDRACLCGDSAINIGHDIC